MVKKVPRSELFRLRRAKRTRLFLLALLLLTLLLVALRTLSLGEASFPTVPTLSQIGAAIGATVSVEPNPYNTLAEQLKNKEGQLSLRERALEESERAIGSRSQKADTLLQYLLAASGMLLFLILLNFYFDWRRTTRLQSV